MSGRGGLDHAEILGWLRERDPRHLAALFARADAVRGASVGDEILLRGLVEISNHCVRACAYCGLRAENAALPRYRATAEEVLGCARAAAGLGYGTVVLQAGEDAGLSATWLAGIVRAIKGETSLAVTLGLGERSPEELTLLRLAGADRYLLKFETSDAALYRALHPARPGARWDRRALLGVLRHLGYEVGSGVMVGLPGQTYSSLADDVLLFAALDLDMIGVGPWLPHPHTPLGRGERPSAPAGEQVPNDAVTTLKVVALARLVCPRANIPATTALATLDPAGGRQRALACGANVVMPNLTPAAHRAKYEIYPGKARPDERRTAWIR